MPKLSFVFTLIFSLLIFFEIKRKGYSPYLAIGAILIGIYAPFLLIPIYLFLSFTRNKTFRFKQNPPQQRRLEIPKICPKCGHENPPSTSTCQNCANQLSL